jgi:ATPase subunit of ABC transporter with duplicated ATPase domains
MYNPDLGTRDHVAEALQEYPDAMIIILHDKSLLKAVTVAKYYAI